MFSSMLKEHGCSCHEGPAGTNSYPGRKALTGASCEDNVPAPSRDTLLLDSHPTAQSRAPGAAALTSLLAY